MNTERQIEFDKIKNIWAELAVTGYAKDCIEATEIILEEKELRKALLDETGELAHLADAAQVALHVGHETRHAGLAEGFGQHLQGDGLAGAGGAGDEAVAVRHLADDGDRAVGGVGYVQPAFFIKHVYLFLRYFQR